MIAAIAFTLGMTLSQVTAACPNPLVPVFETRQDYVSCDDGKTTTILALDNSKRVVGIFDLKWYAQFGQMMAESKRGR